MKRILLINLAIITTIVATEPAINWTPRNQPVTDPVAHARNAVQWHIAMRLQPKYPPFSRAIAMPPTPQFLAVEEVDQEKRLPFLIKAGHNNPEVKGYVRLSDNGIFIYRPDTKDYIPSTQDPRFAPPPAPKIEVGKPA